MVHLLHRLYGVDAPGHIYNMWPDDDDDISLLVKTTHNERKC